MFYGLQVSLCFHCSKGNGKGRRRNAQWNIRCCIKTHFRVKLIILEIAHCMGRIQKGFVAFSH